MSDIIEMQKQAVTIATRYRAIGARQGHADWSARDYANGFMKDIGDLTKLLMIKDNLRSDGDSDINAKLAHELSDCLWSVLVIADKLGVNIDDAFQQTMHELDERLKKEETK